MQGMFRADACEDSKNFSRYFERLVKKAELHGI
jgi:hypothetical protein